jgi:hypothetical protein
LSSLVESGYFSILLAGGVAADSVSFRARLFLDIPSTYVKFFAARFPWMNFENILAGGRERVVETVSFHL